MNGITSFNPTCHCGIPMIRMVEGGLKCGRAASDYLENPDGSHRAQAGYTDRFSGWTATDLADFYPRRVYHDPHAK